MQPMLLRIWVRWLAKFFPKIAIVPLLGAINDNIHRIVVLFPAPLGPKKPNTSPLFTVNETSFTASNMPNFLETKYEDLMTDFNGTLTRIFKYYCFTTSMINTALKIAGNHNINTKDQTALNNDNHITNKSLDLDKWKQFFSDSELKHKFWEVYPSNIFTKIGYTNYLA